MSGPTCASAGSCPGCWDERRCGCPCHYRDKRERWSGVRLYWLLMWWPLPGCGARRMRREGRTDRSVR